MTELVYKKGKAFDELEKPIQTRFIRVVIEEAEKGEEDTKYIGLKMELYGCYIAEKLPSGSNRTIFVNMYAMYITHKTRKH